MPGTVVHSGRDIGCGQRGQRWLGWDGIGDGRGPTCVALCMCMCVGVCGCVCVCGVWSSLTTLEAIKL